MPRTDREIEELADSLSVGQVADLLQFAESVVELKTLHQIYGEHPNRLVEKLDDLLVGSSEIVKLVREEEHGA